MARFVRVDEEDMMTTMRRAAPLWALGLSCVASGAGAQSLDLTSIVDSFYPGVLTQLAVDAGDPPVRKQCHAVLERDALGSPTVVLAGYTNLVDGAVRVLVSSKSGFVNAAELSDQEFTLGGVDV